MKIFINWKRIISFNYNNFNCKIHEINQEFKTYPKISKREAIGMIHNMVREIVVSRSIADVSLGTFFSGGVDSIAYYSNLVTLLITGICFWIRNLFYLFFSLSQVKHLDFVSKQCHF
jgi:hypothetical protein